MIKHIINGEIYCQYFIIFRKIAIKSLIIYCQFMDCGSKNLGEFVFFEKIPQKWKTMLEFLKP
jgi:hypothetical protein